MSRRDTIIVAVLINAGLLIVLFASALKSNSPSADLAANSVSLTQDPIEPVLKKEQAFTGGDEVDQALSQFSQAQMAMTTSSASTTSSPMIASETPVASAPVSSFSSSFADDLKAINPPEPIASAPSPAPQVLTAPISPQTKSSTDYIEIKVKKGDVLEKIARHHHTTVAEIMKVNKLTNTNLRIGQVLKIPNKSIKKAEVSSIAHSQQPVSSHSEPAQNDSTSKFYTVKKGDSPWTIAVKNHLKVEDLLKLNNMNEEQARRLKPGDQIRIK